MLQKTYDPKTGKVTLDFDPPLCPYANTITRIKVKEKDKECPFFISTDACFLARDCIYVMDDKISEKEVDQRFIESEMINDTFYINRFMEVN